MITHIVDIYFTFVHLDKMLKFTPFFTITVYSTIYSLISLNMTLQTTKLKSLSCLNKGNDCHCFGLTSTRPLREY